MITSSSDLWSVKMLKTRVTAIDFMYICFSGVSNLLQSVQPLLKCHIV